MSNAVRFTTPDFEPEQGAPAAEKIISGNPQFRTWNLDEAEGGIYAGFWEATPGKWHIVYDEWEYFNILSGYSILTGEDGTEYHLRAGDRLVVRSGFKGTWEVVEKTLKDYVIRL